MILFISGYTVGMVVSALAISFFMGASERMTEEEWRHHDSLKRQM